MLPLPTDVEADLPALIARALAEDVGSGDVTTTATVGPDVQATGRFLVKEDGVVAGLAVAERVFAAVDPGLALAWTAADGDRVAAGTTVGTVYGAARSILVAERLALNLVQRMSGIATAAHAFTKAARPAIVLDTRKTVPGLRLAEKYAARMGGARNHRLRLDDGVLIKDNHVAACGGVAKAVRAAKAAETGLQVQVEVDRIDQIEPALAAGADRLLLDNMPPPVLREAV
ncbi:MAG TPA: carboxylating nicotinate-nucleotide diphosphorylase, partial [Rubricoccaceae bacterium]